MNTFDVDLLLAFGWVCCNKTFPALRANTKWTISIRLMNDPPKHKAKIAPIKAEIVEIENQ